MNKNIEIVKKWLADSSSVTQAELEASAKLSKSVAYKFAAETGATKSTIADICSYACVDASEGLRSAVEWWVERYEKHADFNQWQDSQLRCS